MLKEKLNDSSKNKQKEIEEDDKFQSDIMRRENEKLRQEI